MFLVFTDFFNFDAPSKYALGKTSSSETSKKINRYYRTRSQYKRGTLFLSLSTILKSRVTTATQYKPDWFECLIAIIQLSFRTLSDRFFFSFLADKCGRFVPIVTRLIKADTATISHVI